MDWTEVIELLSKWLNQSKDNWGDNEKVEMTSLVLVCINKLPLSREVIRTTMVLILITLYISWVKYSAISQSIVKLNVLKIRRKIFFLNGPRPMETLMSFQGKGLHL